MKVLKGILKVIGTLALLVALALGISYLVVAYQTSRQNIAYQEKIEKYAGDYNLDPLLVASLVKVESDYNNEAKSSQNAVGLMQLIDDTAKHAAELTGEKYYPDKLKDPDYNLNLGVAYFSYLDDYYGNDNLAIAAYNAGLGNVDKWIEEGKITREDLDFEDIPNDETRKYVARVNATYDVYKKFYYEGLPSKKDLDNRKGLAYRNYKIFLSDIRDDLL